MEVTESHTNVTDCISLEQSVSFAFITTTTVFKTKIHPYIVCKCLQAYPVCVLFFSKNLYPCIRVFTWQGWSQAMRGSAGGDASDDAVKQETDLLSFCTGQEENTSPWKMDGRETDSRATISDEEMYIYCMMDNLMKKHDGVGGKKL